MTAIICIGGLTGIKSKENIFLPYKPRKVDKEIILLSKKEHPKVLFIGTASKEREDYYYAFKAAYEELGAIVSNLLVLNNNNISNKEMEEKILESDIIYVGCGRTQFMLDTWKEKGIDKLLKKAYEKGIILAGMSAGSYCWFKYNYELIEGLGLIPKINCVHYNEKTEEKKLQFFDNIRKYNLEGIALDDDIALAFIDGKYKIIKNDENANAYHVEFDKDKLIIKTIDA